MDPFRPQGDGGDNDHDRNGGDGNDGNIPGVPKWLGAILSVVFNKWGVTSILLAGVLYFILGIINTKLDAMIALGTSAATATGNVSKELEDFHKEHDREDGIRDQTFKSMLHYMQVSCLHDAYDAPERARCIDTN